MDNSWENVEPSPLEFFHGELMKAFHKFRESHTKSIFVIMDGVTLNDLIVETKTMTYKKYEALNLDKIVSKEKLIK